MTPLQTAALLCAAVPTGAALGVAAAHALEPSMTAMFLLSAVIFVCFAA